MKKYRRKDLTVYAKQFDGETIINGVRCEGNRFYVLYGNHRIYISKGDWVITALGEQTRVYSDVDFKERFEPAIELVFGTVGEDSVDGKSFKEIWYDLMPKINEIKWVEHPLKITPAVNGQTSDGYHTFDELYEFRKLYNAALFSEWANPNTTYYRLGGNSIDGVESYNGPLYNVHKSIRHNDGELCFGGGWFIVVAVLPTGQISNHYKIEDWDLFKVPEFDKAQVEFDGHTPADVVTKLKDFIKNY